MAGNSELTNADATDGSRLGAPADFSDPSTASVAKDQDPVPSSLGSAGNALRHGLTARTALPQALRLRTEHYLTELGNELHPVGCLVEVQS